MRTRREWEGDDWTADVTPHRYGRRVTVRFRASDAPAHVLRVRDILNQSVRILFYDPRCTDSVYLPVVFRERGDLVLTNAMTGSMPALPEAAPALKTRRFVARLLRGLATHGVDPTDEWRSAPRRMREDPRFALRLVLGRARCPRAAVAAGASPRARAFLAFYMAMVPLGLCAQRATLLGEAWSAVGRYVGEFLYPTTPSERVRWWRRYLAAAATSGGEDPIARARAWRRAAFARALRFGRTTIVLRRLF